MPKARLLMPEQTEIATEEAVILVPSWYGATANQDTGRLAQLLANSTGLGVIACNQPLINPFKYIYKSTPEMADNYLVDLERTADAVAKVLDKSGLAPKVIIGNSHSGAATTMFGLTRLQHERLPITAVGASEVIGSYRQSYRLGFLAHYMYQKQQKKIFTHLGEHFIKPQKMHLPIGQSLGLFLSHAYQGSIDSLITSQLYHSDVAALYLTDIADLQDVELNIEYSAVSKCVPIDMSIDDYAEEFNALLTERRLKSCNYTVSTLGVRVIDATTHSSYDRPDMRLRLISPLLVSKLGLLGVHYSNDEALENLHRSASQLYKYR